MQKHKNRFFDPFTGEAPLKGRNHIRRLNIECFSDFLFEGEEHNKFF